jgi:hypothetical protein
MAAPKDRLVGASTCVLANHEPAHSSSVHDSSAAVDAQIGVDGVADIPSHSEQGKVALRAIDLIAVKTESSQTLGFAFACQLLSRLLREISQNG